MGFPRIIWLVFIAMLMFSGGVALEVFAQNHADRVVGVIAMLGAIAIVLANVNGKNK